MRPGLHGWFHQCAVLPAEIERRTLLVVDAEYETAYASAYACANTTNAISHASADPFANAKANATAYTSNAFSNTKANTGADAVRLLGGGARPGDLLSRL